MNDRAHPELVRQRTRLSIWVRVGLAALLVASLLTLIFVPTPGALLAVLWFWALLLIALAVSWRISGRARAAQERIEAIPPAPLLEGDQPEVVREIMDVRAAITEGGVAIFRGTLREPAESAFQRLKQSLGASFVPLLQEDEQFGTAVILMPKPVEQATLERPAVPWVNWLLFALTIGTTTWVGAAYQGVDLLQDPGRFAAGLPYSLGLLAILGVHELGHFFAARRHGMNVTPPYFIPVPFALGTFGAFIKMRSPPEDRESLFDVAVSGPLAGLVIAIPALLVGLQSSEVIGRGLNVGHEAVVGSPTGPSILFGLLAKASLGPQLLPGDVLRLSPLAFAGWLGLFITGLNLLPIGQLDGGHTARAMFGDRAGRTISTVALWALFLLALLKWPSLMMWVIIVFFLAGRSTPPLNDLTPITRGRQVVGWITFAILAMILIPMPSGWW